MARGRRGVKSKAIYSHQSLSASVSENRERKRRITEELVGEIQTVKSDELFDTGTLIFTEYILPQIITNR